MANLRQSVEKSMRKLLSSKPLRRLAARINLLVFIATMASSVAVSVISLQSLDEFFKGRVEQRFPEIASRMSDELEHWYTLRAREIEVFAASSILAETIPNLKFSDRRGTRARDEAEQYLQYVRLNFPYFERLVVSTTDGASQLEVGGENPLPDGFLKAHVRNATGTNVSKVGNLDGRNVQIASTSVKGSLSEIARLHAFIDLGVLSPILSSEDLGEGARAFLLDSQNRYLNPREGVPAHSQYAGPDFSRESDSGAAAIHFDEYSNQRVVSTRTEIPHFEWTLVVEQPYDVVFAPVVASMTRALALNVVIVVACCFVALKLSRSIVRPLRALAEGARRLSEGERDVEIDEGQTSEEIQLLTKTFNEMSRSIGAYGRELEENHQMIEDANQELRRKNEELSKVNLVLEQLSITDGLTKLHNHRYFQDTIQKACKRSQRTREPLSLLLVDIDYFKRWNDRLGHAGGDEILRRIAELLMEEVRETDLLARYGGEEFAILATDTPIEGATALAEKLREAVEESSFLTDLPSEREQLTVSVGVAAFRGDRKRLFADADSALYSAKDAGRNCVRVAKPGEPSSDE